MFRKTRILVILLLLMGILLVACGGDDADTTTNDEPASNTETTNDAPEPTDEPVVEEAGLKVCQVTDAGGIDDKSFNATAWQGVLRAGEELGAEA